MTRFQKIIIALLSLLVVLVCIAVAGLAATRLGWTFPSLSQSSLSLPAVPSPKCSDSAYFQQASDIVRHFSDTNTLAASTARIGLAPIISELQSSRREFDKLVEPECAQRFKSMTLSAMNSNIQANLDFMSEQPDAVVQLEYNTASSAWIQAQCELQNIQGKSDGSSNCGGGSGGGDSTKAVSYTITAAEFKYNPSTITAAPGQTVNITLVNEGAVRHSFVLTEANFALNADQGQSATGSFKAPTSGSYTFFCDQPGHKDAGMLGTLLVR